MSRVLYHFNHMTLPDRRNEDTFLGERISTWLKILEAADCRRITVSHMIERYEKLDPIEHYAWREQFGILAEIADACETQ